MEKEKSFLQDRKNIIIIALIAAMIICGLLAYKTGADSAKTVFEAEKETLAAENEKLVNEKEYLQTLNRVDLEHLTVNDGPIYVIGHKSPDSDTVISAMAWADILNRTGHEAIPVITEKVNNETAYILEQAGAKSPEILYDASGLNIFLVDHSELVQGVDNLVDANIVGIIDHHGVGTVNVGSQVLYNAKPIGSASTIMWLNYLNYGLEIDKQMAHLLLGAILSDTSNLTISSSTSADKEAIDALAKIAEVDDVEGFYKEIHRRYLSYDGLSNEEIIFSDYKEYESSGVKYGVGLANAVDDESAAALAEQIAVSMKDAKATKDVDLMYVSIRAEDKKNDYVIPADERSEDTLKAAFPNYDEYNGVAYIYKGGLGRKSKFVPGLNDFLASHPHE